MDASGRLFGVSLVLAGIAFLVLNQALSRFMSRLGERFVRRPFGVNPLGLVAAGATWVLLGLGLVLRWF
jgi:hypothetical protein